MSEDRPNWGPTQIRSLERLYATQQVHLHHGDDRGREVEFTSDPYKVSGVWMIDYESLENDDAGQLMLSNYGVVPRVEGDWHPTNWIEAINE